MSKNQSAIVKACEPLNKLIDALERENERLRDALETIADTGGEIEREQAREALEEAK
jgi:prefoldin subunit 5